MQRYPSWLKRSFTPDGVARTVHALIDDLALETVCESARCPNLRECYSQRQLTFMILGNVCTRSCRFCAVPHGRPAKPSADEPQRISEAVRRLGLQHVVITSVARDDLADEGIGHFIACIRAVRRDHPGTTIEVLVPDFHAREALLRQLVSDGQPEVFAHNVETIERLSGLLRPQADYQRSLRVLRTAASISRASLVKSSLMVGLGETPEELHRTFDDLIDAGVTHVTIGQYLRPDADHLPVMEYVSPQQFHRYQELAYARGFTWVTSGPFVRSSYHAVDALRAPRDRGTDGEVSVSSHSRHQVSECSRGS